MQYKVTTQHAWASPTARVISVTAYEHDLGLGFQLVGQSIFELLLQNALPFYKNYIFGTDCTVRFS